MDSRSITPRELRTAAEAPPSPARGGDSVAFQGLLQRASGETSGAAPAAAGRSAELAYLRMDQGAVPPRSDAQRIGSARRVLYTKILDGPTEAIRAASRCGQPQGFVDFRGLPVDGSVLDCLDAEPVERSQAR